MAKANSTHSTHTNTARKGSAATAEFLQIVGAHCTRMDSFFNLVEREIREANNTDFDNIETLVSGARAALSAFGAEAERYDMKNSKPDSSAEYLAGAANCMDFMRGLDQILAGDNTETTAEYFRKNDDAMMTIRTIAGELSPRGAGVLDTLAELLVTERAIQGRLDLEVFRPETTMTKSEREAARHAFAGELAAMVPTC